MNLSQVDISTSLSALVDKLQGWLDGLILLVPNLVLAVVIVTLTGLIAKLVESLVEKTMNRATSYTTLNSLAATCARVATLAVGLFVAGNSVRIMFCDAVANSSRLGPKFLN